MNARFAPSHLWAHLRSTYWFVPGLMCAAAVALAFGTVHLDRRFVETLSVVPWLYRGGADGARLLLSAVVGSMITAVSVTFSVTVVALTVASQHYGPRLLTNFMRDTSAQVVLGAFISTFAYCLLVLRVVRGDSQDLDAFVPHLAVTGAVGMTLVSIAAFIYYVHHVSSSIQISQIALVVTRDLLRSIDRLYPAHIGDPPSDGPEPPSRPEAAVPIPAIGEGYVESIDADGLMALVSECDTVVWIVRRPGDFAVKGAPLAYVHPGPAELPRFTDRLNATFIVGPERTSRQDAEYAIHQLVEVALRALSPGVNEPFTALTCIDRLTQGLSMLASRRPPPAARTDRHGRVRVVAPPRTFPELLTAAFDPILLFAGTNPAIYERVLGGLAVMARLAPASADREAIGRQADAVVETAARQLERPADRGRIERAHGEVIARLADGPAPSAS